MEQYRIVLINKYSKKEEPNIVNYIMQLAIIAIYSFVGELLAKVLPFGIPASIYGMFLLFICLFFGIIKLEWIKETGNFLLDIMPVLFVPVCVGVIDSWVQIKSFLVPVILAILLITPIVMVTRGKVAKCFIRRR